MEMCLARLTMEVDVDLAEFLQSLPLCLRHVQTIHQDLHAPLAPSCGQKMNISHARPTHTQLKGKPGARKL